MANEFKIKNGLVVSGSADIEQDLIVHGTITAEQFNVSIVSSSVMFESGSTKFGDTFDDNHSFTGSLQITGSINLNGQDIGESKLDETTFNDFTSSYTNVSTSIDSRLDTLETLSGSFTGSFSGSFSGDGTNIFNIPASGVTGLNLTQISDGSVTASVSNTNGLRVNSKTEITGSLIVTNGISGSLDYSDITNKPTLISGSSQVILSGTTGYESFNSGITTLFFEQNNRLSSIETSTGSLNSFTSSIITTIKDKLNSDNVISGSEQVIITGTTGYSTFSSSISSSIGGLSSSFASTNLNQNSRLSSLETASGSVRTDFNTYTGSNNNIINTLQVSTASLNTFTSSTNTRLNTIETTTGSLNTFTSSASTRLSSLETASSSIRSDFNTYTSSNNTTNTSQTNRLNSIESTTGSLNTFTSSASTRLNSLETASGSIRTDFNTYTGSNNTTNTAQNNRLNSLETSTGSLNTHTASINTFTSSTNTFINNVNGGIEFTGSNVTIKGNLLVKGTNTTVNSTTLDIGDNIISLNGTGVSNGGLVVRDATSPNTVSGSLLWDTTNDKWIAGALGSEDDIVLRTATQTLTNKTINASQLVNSSVTNAKLASSSITIAGTSTSLGGSITAATILSGTGTVSGSAQILNGTGFVKVDGTTVSYDNSTYLTTGTAGTTYVPYTGATSNVDLGANSIIPAMVYISGEGGGGGVLNLKKGTSRTVGGADAANTISIWADGTSLGFSDWVSANTRSAKFSVASITNNTTRTYTLPNSDGTIALTSNIPTLSSLGGQTQLNGTGFVKVVGTTVSYDNSTYLTTLTDTLATVTTRGNTTNGGINVNGNILLTGTATTTNQARTIDFTGFDKEGTTDFSDRAYIQHTTNTGGHAGSVLVISSENDADDGIAFLTNASSKLKHNSNNIATEAFVTSQGYITSVGSITGTSANVTGIVAVANGGTGASDAATARTNLGLAIGTNVLAQRTFGTAANNNTGDFAAFNAVHFVGTTSIAANRASAAQTLTGVSIDGNATTAVNLSGLGTIQSTSTGTSYTANYQVRENSGGSGNTNEIYAPQLGFHWSGVVASSIMMESSGRIAIRNNPGGSYENFAANAIYANNGITSAGNILPSANNSFNLGSPSLGWANIYTNDLHLSNMNKPEGNEIDGTNGTWTIQEGAENLYIINNRNNKKFKITLEEIL